MIIHFERSVLGKPGTPTHSTVYTVVCRGRSYRVNHRLISKLGVSFPIFVKDTHWDSKLHRSKKVRMVNVTRNSIQELDLVMFVQKEKVHLLWCGEILRPCFQGFTEATRLKLTPGEHRRYRFEPWEMARQDGSEAATVTP